jgi:hypothetical protein
VSTIREHLTRQAKLVRSTMIAGLVLMGVVAFALVHLHIARPVAKAYLLAGALLIGGISLLLQRRMRCPRCNVSLANLSGGALIAGGVNYCPKCGANLDEQMPP